MDQQRYADFSNGDATSPNEDAFTMQNLVVEPYPDKKMFLGVNHSICGIDHVEYLKLPTFFLLSIAVLDILVFVCFSPQY